MPSEPRLVLLDGFVPARQALPLETFPFIIGRARECHFVVDHGQVSRLHARLELDHEQITLLDLNSTNGTYVNGERIAQPIALKPSQTFKIGDTVFYLAL